MARKKTPEELERAAHNRLKGTICFHVSSTLSQADCVLNMLNKFEESSESDSELKAISELYAAMIHIKNAIQKYQQSVYTKLEIGSSPTSYRNKCSRNSSYFNHTKQYGTHK